MCADHSLGNAISYCTGKKSYKEGSSRAAFNNPEGAALLKSSCKQAKVFMKSWPKKKKLIDIQKLRITEKLPPFCSGITTSLTKEGPRKRKMEPLALVLPGDTR